MLLMIDNYDSFVYNLVMYLEEEAENVRVYRNDSINIEEIKKLNPEGIIISPGPKAPKDVMEVNKIIEEFKGEIPILGVCLGHQCIGYTFGGEIVKGETPVHGKISKVINNGQGLFKGLPKEFKVTRYHSLIIKKNSLLDDFEIDCETEDGVIMGIRHEKFKIYGIQYHPEAVLTECGHEILRNFIRICKEEKDEL